MCYLLLIINISFAQLNSQNVILDELPEVSKSIKKNELKNDLSKKINNSNNDSAHLFSNKSIGNLPRNLLRKKIISAAQNPVIYAKLNEKEKHTGLVRSSILNARINDSIIAYEGSITSVKAIVSDGPYKGYVLFGNASMDKVTKHVSVIFDTLLNLQNEEYQFLAELKSVDGVQGIEGKFESDYWRYFWTQFALDTAAASVQSSAEVTRDVLGQYQVKPNSENVLKLGVAGGLSKTAERISERNQYIPEYVKVNGPIYVRVSILKQPEKR